MAHMTALATLSSSEIGPRTAFDQLKAVEQIINTIDSADILVDVIDRAKLAAAWLKVKNVAGDVVLQAARVQLSALRRIGQLGDDAIEIIPDISERKFAKCLGELTDARFYGELDALERPVKASTFILNIESVHSRANWLNKGYDIGNGKPRSDSEWYELAVEAESRERDAKLKTPIQKQREQAARAERERQDRRDNNARIDLTGQLLGELYKAGDPFSVSAATDKMMDLLVETDCLPFDPRNDSQLQNGMDTQLVREGVAAAVRHALMDANAFDNASHESLTVSGSQVYPPKFVTYMDNAAGWVRIPWSTAGLSQLQEMAALRRRQAAQLAEKADELTALVSALEAAHVQSPQESKCANLFRNTRQSGN